MATKVISSKFVISSPSLELCPASDLFEYAFIGRSNVGKSSLINALCNKKGLAKTSPKPGKTQLINYFEIESIDDEKNSETWHLVDLPGYGYAKVDKNTRDDWQGMISDYILHRKNLKNLFVLIDSKIPMQQIDLEFINWLNSSHIPFSIVFTKSDKSSQKELSANIKTFMGELSTMMRKLPDYFVTTTEKNVSVQPLISALHKLQQSS